MFSICFIWKDKPACFACWSKYIAQKKYSHTPMIGRNFKQWTLYFMYGNRKLTNNTFMKVTQIQEICIEMPTLHKKVLVSFRRFFFNSKSSYNLWFCYETITFGIHIGYLEGGLLSTNRQHENFAKMYRLFGNKLDTFLCVQIKRFSNIFQVIKMLCFTEYQKNVK